MYVRYFCSIFFILLALTSSILDAKEVLRAGWYSWDPYQYLEDQQGGDTLTGVDIKILRAVAKKAGLSVTQSYVPWSEQINQLKSGDLDIATGASWSRERAKNLHYSIPYRQERNVLITLKSTSLNFEDFSGLLALVKSGNLTLGVVQGFVYVDERLNNFIKSPQASKYIKPAVNDQQNFQRLLSGEIDAFFADRIVAATMIWRMKIGHLVQEFPLLSSKPIHFIFSQKTISSQQVKEFNTAIKSLKTSGEYGAIVKDYLFPVLLMQTIDQSWFFIIDLLGTMAFAISGLLVAYRERASLFGTLVIAALPAVGGGVIRDLLVDRRPLAILSTPSYMLIIFMTVFIGTLCVKFIRLPLSKPLHYRLVNYLYQLVDALGLAAFTIIGVVVALMTRSEPLWLWAPLLAAITGAGGGILRDTFRKDKYIMSLMGEIYAEIALFWGVLFALFLQWQQERMDPDEIFYAVIVVLIGGVVTRLAVVSFNIRSPLFGKIHEN